MSNFRNLTDYTEQRLISTSTTVQYAWFTDWETCDGIDNIRAVLKSKNSSAAFGWQLAIQYAAVRADDPGSPATLATAQSGSVEYQTGDVSVATNMAANRLFRLGIAYSSPSGGVQQADVALLASYKSVGTQLGRKSLSLGVVDNGTKYEPLTGWVPATFMSKIKAAFMLNGITGASSNFRYQLAYQTAGTNLSQPNAWTNAETNGFVTPSITYNERNTGEIAVSTSDMFIRLGVAYSMTSGVDTNVTAQLDAICSVR